MKEGTQWKENSNTCTLCKNEFDGRNLPDVPGFPNDRSWEVRTKELKKHQ